MAIPESIKQKANKIRNEVYGRDVREALASGIEEAGDIADQTRERQDSVEAQFQSVLDETTGKDVISAPEITAARVGADNTNYPNLKERLDTEHNQLSSQLAQIAVQITEFGASETLEDNTQPIQNAIDYVASMGGGVVLIPNGTFLIKGSTEDNIFLQSNVSIKGNGNQSVLKISDNTGNWGAMFKIKDQYCENITIANIM